MKFCIKCDNMCYISINPDNPNEITVYCRVCGYTDNTSDELCILNTQYSKTNDKNDIINNYTKLDPTLPHLYNINCINSDCKCNTDSKINSDVIFIRYDEQHLKNLYLCTHCDSTWKTSDK